MFAWIRHRLGNWGSKSVPKTADLGILRYKKSNVVPVIGRLTARLLPVAQRHQYNVDGKQYAPADQEGSPESGLFRRQCADSGGNKDQRKEEQSDKKVLARYLHVTDCYTLFGQLRQEKQPDGSQVSFLQAARRQPVHSRSERPPRSFKVPRRVAETSPDRVTIAGAGGNQP